MNSVSSNVVSRSSVFLAAVLFMLPSYSFAGNPTETLRGTIDQVLARMQARGLDMKRPLWEAAFIFRLSPILSTGARDTRQADGKGEQ